MKDYGYEWTGLNGNFMKDISYSKVDVESLVTKDDISGKFVPLDKNCLVVTGVDDLDETHKVTVHYNPSSGVYTVIGYEGGL